MFDMNRRKFITLLSGAAAAWPLRARAQQPTKLRIIGYLGSSTALAQSQWVAAFLQRLRQLGWVEGRTIAMEYRWAEGRSDRFAEIAAEFARLKVDVIVTSGTVPTLAAKRTTSDVPIVFAVASDPLGNALVASLARPGGNVTVCQFSRPILRLKNSHCCETPFPISAGWPLWRILAVLPVCLRWARSKQPRALSGSRSRH